MDNNGHLWTTMDNNGQQWIIMDTNGEQLTTKNKKGQQWTTIRGATCISDSFFFHLKLRDLLVPNFKFWIKKALSLLDFVLCDDGTVHVLCFRDERTR